MLPLVIHLCLHCKYSCTVLFVQKDDGSQDQPHIYTVKFLSFGTRENFAVIYLKFKQRGQNLRVFRQKDATGIAKSEDPDQTAPLGAV